MEDIDNVIQQEQAQEQKLELTDKDCNEIAKAVNILESREANNGTHIHPDLANKNGAKTSTVSEVIKAIHNKGVFTDEEVKDILNQRVEDVEDYDNEIGDISLIDIVTNIFKEVGYPKPTNWLNWFLPRKEDLDRFGFNYQQYIINRALRIRVCSYTAIDNAIDTRVTRSLIVNDCKLEIWIELITTVIEDICIAEVPEMRDAIRARRIMREEDLKKKAKLANKLDDAISKIKEVTDSEDTTHTEDMKTSTTKDVVIDEDNCIQGEVVDKEITKNN